MHRRLTHAARDWDAAGRDTSALDRGARLAAALDWAATHDADLNETERAFLAASRSAGERAQRRLRAGLAGVASLLVLAVIAGLVALKSAETPATRRWPPQPCASARRRSWRTTSTARSCSPARGMTLRDSVQTRSNLLAALLKSPAAIGVVRGDGDRLIGLDLSPDGGTLDALARQRRNAQLRRLAHAAVRGSRDHGLRYHPGVIIDAASVGLDFLQFSPDGSRLAVGGGEPVVIDVRTRREALPLAGRRAVRLRLALRGRRTRCSRPSRARRFAAAIQSFDARSGRPLGPERQIRETGDVALLGTSSGRRLVTTVDEPRSVDRDSDTLRPLRRVPSVRCR